MRARSDQPGITFHPCFGLRLGCGFCRIFAAFCRAGLLICFVFRTGWETYDLAGNPWRFESLLSNQRLRSIPGSDGRAKPPSRIALKLHSFRPRIGIL